MANHGMVSMRYFILFISQLLLLSFRYIPLFDTYISFCIVSSNLTIGILNFMESHGILYLILPCYLARPLKTKLTCNLVAVAELRASNFGYEA